MSLPRYATYTDTNLTWLRQIPSHWVLTRVKHVCSFSTGWTPPTGDASSYEGNNLWANISDLGQKVITDTAKRISDAAVAKSGLSLVPKGRLLFSFKLSIGQVSFVGSDMYTNEAIAAFHPSSKLDLGFAYYAFPSFLVENASENIYGAKLLNQELIKSAQIVLPSVPEQTAIAAFLDRETVKIDTLVEEQQRLIALLKEKRQAVISHAVTKGLDPNAPVKDSGVEWLGEVPAHWAIRQLKHAIDIATSGPRGWSETTSDTGAIFFQSQNIGRAMNIVLEDVKRVNPIDDAESRRAKLHENDVVVCITGARTGTVAHVKNLSDQAYINQHVCLLRPDTDLVAGRFLAYALSSHSGQEQLNIAMYGLKQGLGLEQVRTHQVSLPPLVEQSAITKHLDEATGRLDDLVSEAETAIALLKERRSALIAAAVTGKIDVRGLLPSQAEAA